MVLVLLALLLYLALWPTPVDPSARRVAPAPALVGVFAPNQRLREGTASIDLGEGPEDVALGPDGLLYTGLADGRIVRLPVSLASAQPWADTGGRPLGLAFDRDGRLLVADAHRGLLAIDREAQVTVLVDAFEGTRLRLADELAIATSGAVWFTDASTRFAVEDHVLDALENRATGRLLRHEPETGETTLVLDGLRFANGVALAPDESFVLVAETFDYRVTRLWLQGPDAGHTDVLVADLPGFVDNLTYADDGVLWVALVSRRSELLDATLPWPWVRKVIARVPMALQPIPPRYGFVLGIGDDGSVLHNLQDDTGTVGAITSAVPVGDELVLGSLRSRVLVRVPRPQLPPR